MILCIWCSYLSAPESEYRPLNDLLAEAGFVSLRTNLVLSYDWECGIEFDETDCLSDQYHS